MQKAVGSSADPIDQQDEALCWALADATPPHTIKEISPEWSATWLVDCNKALGNNLGSLLDEDECDAAANKMLMAQFSQRGSATQRCRKMRSDGLLIEHTVSIVQAIGGILAISTDCHPKLPGFAPNSSGRSAPASLTAIGARIAAEHFSMRERAGRGAPSDSDVLAARIDLLEDMLEDYADRLKASRSLASNMSALSVESCEGPGVVAHADEPKPSILSTAATKRPDAGARSCEPPPLTRPLPDVGCRPPRPIRHLLVSLHTYLTPLACVTCSSHAR
jgi:hypothetical protein